MTVQETHFPYTSGLADLLCDKPENKQQQQARSPVLDIRAVSSAATIPLTSPEPDSSMSTGEIVNFIIDATLRTYRPCAVTLLATEATELTNTLLADTDKTELVSEEDRTISACSTLEGDEELQSDTESLL